MHCNHLTLGDLDLKTRSFYKHVLTVMIGSRLPFMVCGSYALEAYTNIVRRTKDLDFFVGPVDCAAALRALSEAGYTTSLVYPHWLAKAFSEEDFVDIIFGSGNGLCVVDDSWFAHGVEGTVLDMPVLFLEDAVKVTIKARGAETKTKTIEGGASAKVANKAGGLATKPKKIEGGDSA
jgi:hypothetical protein